MKKNIIWLTYISVLCTVVYGGGFHDQIPTLDLTDPLTCAKAYSVEIDENVNGTDGFFPLGVLGESFHRGFNVAVGGNYTIQGLSPNASLNLVPQGVYGRSIWAAIRAQTIRSLAKCKDQDGKEFRSACLFDPVVVSNIFDYARGCVTNAVAQCDDRIFKWEIDNEYIPGFDYSEPAVTAYREWLEKKCYKGDLDKLNRAWCTNIASFAEAEPCRLDDYAKRPGAFMDWSRFQQETFAEFLRDYYRTIYEADPRHRGVNGKDTQSSLEMQRIARARRADHELIGKMVAPYTGGVRGMDHYGHGDRNAYEMNFYTHTVAPDDWLPGKRTGMLYGENNNHNGPGWQFAQTVWRMIPNGLRGGTFFCNGWYGAWGDWASFGFLNPDGTNREKIWYLPRFYASIHRTERLFTTSAPAKGLPTLAILLAKRDIPFGVDDNMEPWGFPINSRLRVYSHLRDAGYYVNVITYDKLNPEYMKSIDGLFLVAAEHLADEDISNIRAYVKGGGRLFCDARCGGFDEHNLPRETDNLSDVLGVKFNGIWESHDVVVDQGDVWFSSAWGNIVRADGKVRWSPTTAEVVNARHGRNYSNKAAVWTRNEFGKGRVYWTNTQMGTVRSESADDEVPAREMFRQLLADAGINPSYTVAPDETCNLRVEKPLVDARGNCMVAVAARTYRPVPASRLNLRLPEGLRFKKAFYCMAEENELRPLAFERTGGGAIFDLPEIRSAAWLYLLHDHAPLLGTSFARVGRFAAENEKTPLLKSGQPFKVNVQIVNPSAESVFAGGRVKVNALKDWNVSQDQDVHEIAPGNVATFSFDVTVPPEGHPELYPNRIYPLTADLFDVDGKRVSVTHTVVAVDIQKKGHEVLLTDNWVSANMPWAEWTCATYRHVSVPDAANGQEIVDALWTKLGDGTEVYALQSGDRSGRRRAATWKKMAEGVVEFDLKKPRHLTRIFFWESRTNDRTEAPIAVKLSYSADGETFSEPEECAIEWGAEVKDLSRQAEIRFPAKSARYVRLAFTANPVNKRKVMSLDEVWIMGLGE